MAPKQRLQYLKASAFSATGEMVNNHFGHAVYCDDEGVWRFEDTGEESIYESRQRKCPRCKRFRTKHGHDPCIANLPGVRNACCGHGVARGYIQFENGTAIRFEALEVDAKLRERANGE